MLYKLIQSFSLVFETAKLTLCLFNQQVDFLLVSYQLFNLLLPITFVYAFEFFFLICSINSSFWNLKHRFLILAWPCSFIFLLNTILFKLRLAQILSHLKALNCILQPRALNSISFGKFWNGNVSLTARISFHSLLAPYE